MSVLLQLFNALRIGTFRFSAHKQHKFYVCVCVSVCVCVWNRMESHGLWVVGCGCWVVRRLIESFRLTRCFMPTHALALQATDGILIKLATCGSSNNYT